MNADQIEEIVNKLLDLKKEDKSKLIDLIKNIDK